MGTREEQSGIKVGSERNKMDQSGIKNPRMGTKKEQSGSKVESRTQEWEPEKNKAGSKWNQEPKSGNKRGTKIENPQVETREEQSGKEQSATCGAGGRIDRWALATERPRATRPSGHANKRQLGRPSGKGAEAALDLPLSAKPLKTLNPQKPLKTLN